MPTIVTLEDAYFLNLNTPTENSFGANNGQGMMSTDLLNFTNTVSENIQSTPTITTTASRDPQRCGGHGGLE